MPDFGTDSFSLNFRLSESRTIKTCDRRYLIWTTDGRVGQDQLSWWHLLVDTFSGDVLETFEEADS